MTKRKINKTLIRELVRKKGIERTAVDANCSASLIQKLMKEGHETLPKIAYIDGICFSLGKKIDELFPVFDDQKESA